MPCMHPIPAARPSELMRSMGVSRLVLGTPVRDFVESGRADDVLASALLLLPCGSCVGCQISRAREWAIRCSLELQKYSRASFVTLTYAEKYVPPTLSKSDLSKFTRSLRKKLGSLRFFGCGEYGETSTMRPHYHAILFGSEDHEAAQRSWGKGFVTMSEVTPGRIAYTAGYCAKKLGFHRAKGEEIDYSTGEIYTHQPPFLQMSRRPGIAGDFRAHWRSWRSTAIWQGRPFPVPRFLHASYLEHASVSELAALELEKVESRGVVTIRELDAKEQIANSRVRLRSERSQL